MGSDYYIVNFLHIYYNNYDYCDNNYYNKYVEIELVNERGYYNNYDENEKDCKKNTNEYTPLKISIRTADEISTKLPVTDLEQAPLRGAVSNLHRYKNTFRMKPIIIYNNNNFNQLSFDIKYRNIIENEINKYNKKWYEVTKVVKIEERYER